MFSSASLAKSTLCDTLSPLYVVDGLFDLFFFDWAQPEFLAAA